MTQKTKKDKAKSKSKTKSEDNKIKRQSIECESGDRFVVVQKGNRTMIIASPTAKQLSRYKKRDWRLRGRITPDQDASNFSESLSDMLKTVETESTAAATHVNDNGYQPT